MQPHLIDLLIAVCGLLLGGVIGFTFGSLQQAALHRNRKRQQGQDAAVAMTFFSGSLRRTGFLLMVLVAVQVACPMLFEGALAPWIVSAGVVVGYGWTLLKKPARKSAVHG
jgi:membrane protein YqaA with SNARE-associated domain